MSSSAVAEPTSLTERFERLPIEQLEESPLNPRKTFDAHKLEELAASIREKGVIEPLVVRQIDAGSHARRRFEIIAGARRYRAARVAGLTELPAVVRLYTDAHAIEIMAIENGQRDDVPPLEEAAGYAALLGLVDGYSPAMIAAHIGHAEKYVHDRLRLLQLVPTARALLTSHVIGVEHADVLAKLTPEEQARAIHRTTGGLFTPDAAIDFKAGAPHASTAYDHLKPVSVRELKQWVARHIRFNVQQAAATAPLEFGLAAARVAEAEAQPGPGAKVVPITFDHMCPDGAKDPDARTYGSTAWKKAENADGEVTCADAVLGVVVAGKSYGDTFHVCIARDRCTTHWKKEIAEKKKTAELRAKGQGSKAAQREATAREEEQRRYKQQQEQREAAKKAFAAATPAILDVVATRLKAAKAPFLLEFISGDISSPDRIKRARAVLKPRPTADDALRFVTLLLLVNDLERYDAHESFAKIAKRFGVDVAGILKGKDGASKKKGRAA